MRQRLLHLLAAATVNLSVVGALAHAFLDRAEPPVGGTVAASPTEIRLFFIEAIEPRFSGIELATIDGRPVKTGPAVVEPRDPMEYVLPLHSVRWQNRIKLPKGSITSVSSIPQGIAVSGYVTPGYFNAPKAQCRS